MNTNERNRITREVNNSCYFVALAYMNTSDSKLEELAVTVVEKEEMLYKVIDSTDEIFKSLALY